MNQEMKRPQNRGLLVKKKNQFTMAKIQKGPHYVNSQRKHTLLRLYTTTSRILYIGDEANPRRNGVEEVGEEGEGVEDSQT